jgi:hypothetical protein
VTQSESQREINRFLTDDLLAQATPDRGGKDTKVLDLLHRASASIDERFPTRPLVAASVHQTLGDAYAELGELDDAERHIARAARAAHRARGRRRRGHRALGDLPREPPRGASASTRPRRHSRPPSRAPAPSSGRTTATSSPR